MGRRRVGRKCCAARTRSAFADQPRSVDLRFAHAEEQLDLQNPSFSAAVADVASAITDVPKDELAAEEVRQHRRTVRTPWGAGALVLALAIAAGGAALFANAQRKEAAQQASIARSRELAASSVGAVDDNPELATLLAIAAIDATPEGAGTSRAGLFALRQAMQANQLVGRFPGDGSVSARLSADGSTVFMSSPPDRSVSAIDVATNVVLWTYRPGDSVDSLEGDRMVTTGDDDLVKVWDVSAVNDRSSIDQPQLLDQIPDPIPADAVFVGEDRLGVFLANGARWLAVPLDVGDVVAQASAQVTRGFTEAECAAYQIDPCPGLEDIRSR